MKATITAIEVYLPEGILPNEELAGENDGWTAGKIFQKTGIRHRHIAAEGECASDLGVAAANMLFDKGACVRESIDYLLFCTQSPDFFLPTTACLVQERLNLPTRCGALDFNLGCSGYVYGLSLAKGLIESGQAANVLLITAETYSKYIHPDDRSVRTLFGDAGAATLVSGVNADEARIGPFVFGTDGRGAGNLIVPAGGMRQPAVPLPLGTQDADRSARTAKNLFMDGPEIFNFTLRTVPLTAKALLEKTGKSMDDVDLFVFHQANGFILEHLRKKMNIPEAKLAISLESYGNTVSASIPITLRDAALSHKLKAGQLLMLVGFGVGYSWGGVMIKWTG